MADVIAQIDDVSREAHAELQAVTTHDGLEQFRIKYLGAKGAVKGLMNLLKEVPKEQKREFGQKANDAQQHIKTGFDALVQWMVEDAYGRGGAGSSL